MVPPNGDPGHPPRPGCARRRSRRGNARGTRVLPVWPADVHRDGGVVLPHADDLVPAADLRAELRRVLVEQPLDRRFAQLHPLQRRIGQLREVQVDAAEGVDRGRAGVGGGRGEPFQQAAVAQQVEDLPAEPGRPRGLPQHRVALQHERLRAREAQLRGQHQPRRAWRPR